jgi:hypothetical protein
MNVLKWLPIVAAITVVVRANAEGADCPEPTARERKAMRDRKLNDWKRDRRKEAATRGESVAHSTLVLSDDGRAVVREDAKVAGGCRTTYVRVAVPTSACENDTTSEEEFHVGCCAPRACHAGPESYAYAFVDAVSLDQLDAVRRLMPDASALTVTNAERAIRTYRRTDVPARLREMMAELPRWGLSDTIECGQPKTASGKYEIQCSLGSGSKAYRFSLESSGGDLTDDKMVWSVMRVEVSGR